TTFAPEAPSNRAVAAPMPLLAPVTITTSGMKVSLQIDLAHMEMRGEEAVSFRYIVLPGGFGSAGWKVGTAGDILPCLELGHAFFKLGTRALDSVDAEQEMQRRLRLLNRLDDCLGRSHRIARLLAVLRRGRGAELAGGIRIFFHRPLGLPDGPPGEVRAEAGRLHDRHLDAKRLHLLGEPLGQAIDREFRGGIKR